MNHDEDEAPDLELARRYNCQHTALMWCSYSAMCRDCGTSWKDDEARAMVVKTLAAAMPPLEAYGR